MTRTLLSTLVLSGQRAILGQRIACLFSEQGILLGKFTSERKVRKTGKSTDRAHRPSFDDFWQGHT
jgi:hypothetical protein